jgi:uncharacterized protein
MAPYEFETLEKNGRTDLMLYILLFNNSQSSIGQCYRYHSSMLINLTFDQCEEILGSQHYGHLGCIDGEEPYVLPITYIYRNAYILSHTSEGQKIEIMRKHPRVCVQVEKVKDSDSWDSVICWGDFEEVTDPEEMQEIRVALAEQYAIISRETGIAPVSPLISNLHKISTDKSRPYIVYRINIRKTTGKSQRPVPH